MGCIPIDALFSLLSMNTIVHLIPISSSLTFRFFLSLMHTTQHSLTSEMGSDQSRLKHSHSSRDKTTVPSIKLPPSPSLNQMRDNTRSRSGSTSSTKTFANSPRHPIPTKARRLIQSAFANPHDSIGRRAVKRSCEAKPEFTSFYLSMEQSAREEFEENIKMLLNRVVASIDYVEEMERLSEEFGRDLVEWRTKGFRADLLSTLADAVCKECLHLDSAVHRAHMTTHAFAQLGSLIFTSVRNGFYEEIRKKRRTSNSFSSGGSGSSSRRDKKKGEDGMVREDSPRSYSPDSCNSDEYLSTDADDGFLKPPPTIMLSSRSF